MCPSQLVTALRHQAAAARGSPRPSRPANWRESMEVEIPRGPAVTGAPPRLRRKVSGPPSKRPALPGPLMGGYGRRQPAEVHGPEAYSYPTTTCGATSPRSGTDSDVEAFSHYPADGSVAALPDGASYPCGNFSGTSSLKFRGTKGSIGHTFMVCIHTENQNQGDFYPFVLLEISVLHESPLGHLRCGLTDVPPQPNSPPDNVFNPDRPAKDLNARRWAVKPSSASLNK
ncbi:hypothetical protein KXV40_007047 [Aspergillus fumigatus]|nr:hypothetical protein KXV40_007047 [Aspergillus fumigatus]